LSNARDCWQRVDLGDDRTPRSANHWRVGNSSRKLGSFKSRPGDRKGSCEPPTASLVAVAPLGVDSSRSARRPALPWKGRPSCDRGKTNLFAFSLGPWSQNRREGTRNNPLSCLMGIKAIDLGGKAFSQVFPPRWFGAAVRQAPFPPTSDVNVPARGEGNQAARGSCFLIPGGPMPRMRRSSSASFLEQTGYFPVDLGLLDVGGPPFAFAAVWCACGRQFIKI